MLKVHGMRKIIVIESLYPFLHDMSSVLSRQNISLFTASSAKALLELHTREHADLIIMDLDMPGMHGDEVCSVIRNDNTLKSAFIIIVCDNDKAAISRCYACKANAFIPRPVDAKDLFAKIKKFFADMPERGNPRVIVEVIVRGKRKEDHFFALSENISISGILLDTYVNLQKGDLISCSFFLGADQVSCQGKVARVAGREDSEQHQYGIHFTNLTAPEKAKIETFLKSA